MDTDGQTSGAKVTQAEISGPLGLRPADAMLHRRLGCDRAPGVHPQIAVHRRALSGDAVTGREVAWDKIVVGLKKERSDHLIVESNEMPFTGLTQSVNRKEGST